MRRLNLDQLHTFMEVAAQGSFSAAGRRLNLTQPAVSLQVRELEQRLGMRLIERVGRRAYLTAPGRSLIKHAERIFRECEMAESTMRRFRDGWLGRVHFSTTLTALTYSLPTVLKKLRLDYPGIELQVTMMTTRDSVEAVVKNAIDLALVTLPVTAPELRVTPLRPEMLVAILPADTKDVPAVVTPDYAARHQLVLEYDRGAVHSLVMQWLSAHLPLPGQPMGLATIEAMKTVVELGLGMSIVPDIAVAEHSPDIVVRPLCPPAPCTLGLIEHRHKPNEPALEIVRNALLELKTDGLSAE
jgi:DNA-binding transcriptional LysR family regulator